MRQRSADPPVPAVKGKKPLAQKTCHLCDRKFTRGRSDCPHCGALSKGPLGLPWGYSRGWMKKAMVAVVVLVALNLWATATREVGPDPEVEALHSEEEAVRVCREAVESHLTARNPSIVGPGGPEYPQGGEYEVRLAVELQDGRRRTRDEVLCQLQFTAETGWIVEDVSLDPN